jgi:hypothetical protein
MFRLRSDWRAKAWSDAVLVMAATAGAVIVVATSASPAASHICNYPSCSTDGIFGITHDLYTPGGNTSRCVYGPGNCSAHTFSFASANDLANTNYVCAELYHPADHSPPAGFTCNQDFARHCQYGAHEGTDAQHCWDRDTTTLHAGARNGDPWGTTIRRHVVY